MSLHALLAVEHQLTKGDTTSLPVGTYCITIYQTSLQSMSIKLERIREDAADSEWIEAFSAVLQEYEHPNSSAPTPSNSDMVIAFKLIHKKLATYDQGACVVVNYKWLCHLQLTHISELFR